MMRVCVLLCAVLAVAAVPAPAPHARMVALQGSLSMAESIAQTLQAEAAELVKVKDMVDSAERVMGNASLALSRGLCAYKGFCQINPAFSCQEVASQPGLDGADLPDGEYWLQAKPDTIPVGVEAPPERIGCVFDVDGNGWTLMFDDSFAQEVRQEPTSKIMKYFKIREVLAYTPSMLQNNESPVKQGIYFADDTHMETTGGRTLDEMLDQPWAGQDQYGVANDQGMNFPNGQVHHRWKYFGKIQAASVYSGTLYVLDDGDIKEESCKTSIDMEECGKKFKCATENGEKVLAGPVAQTHMPTTPRGVIAFGCSSSAADFTRCGSCTYEGPSDKPALAAKVAASFVQRLFVR